MNPLMLTAPDGVAVDLSGRHASVAGVARWFTHEHLPPHLAAVSAPFAGLAVQLLLTLPDSAELTAGLRKLLEAKDCVVRAAVAELGGREDD